MKPLAVVAVLTALLAIPQTAEGSHDVAPLEDWVEDWSTRVEEGGGLTASLADEYRDMVKMFPRFFGVPKVSEPEPVSSPPEPTSSVSGAYMGGGVERWRSLVSQFFPAGAVNTALCLMTFESGGNPMAYNPSGASGLMQVMDSWADDFGVTPDDLFDPATNLMISAALYLDGGWSHWSPWLAGECH